VREQVKMVHDAFGDAKLAPVAEQEDRRVDRSIEEARGGCYSCGGDVSIDILLWFPCGGLPRFHGDVRHRC
jgi:hypothetical protein